MKDGNVEYGLTCTVMHLAMYDLLIICLIWKPLAPSYENINQFLHMFLFAILTHLGNGNGEVLKLLRKAIDECKRNCEISKT
jgi:hypothetical protein